MYGKRKDSHFPFVYNYMWRTLCQSIVLVSKYFQSIISTWIKERKRRWSSSHVLKVYEDGKYQSGLYSGCFRKTIIPQAYLLVPAQKAKKEQKLSLSNWDHWSLSNKESLSHFKRGWMNLLLTASAAPDAPHKSAMWVVNFYQHLFLSNSERS